MKTFVTLFGRTGNVQLTKDVGMIPYYLGKTDEFDTKVVTLRVTDDYSYLNSEVRGLKVEFMKKYFNSVWINELIYIFKHSKEIDILNLYHLNLRTCLEFWIYRTLNPKGISYLKADLDNRFLKAKSYRTRWKKSIYKRTLQKTSLVTAESTRMCSLLSKYGECNVKYLPNGFAKKIFKRYGEKSNTIITVARLGTYQKNTELLIEAFIQSNIKDWKLKLVGDATEEFKNYLNEKIEKYPDIKEQIILNGHTSNREDLKAIYEDAKIFALPSRYEGFPLVLMEALSAGCYLIVSDAVEPAKDIITEDNLDGLMGCIFPSEDQEALKQALVRATQAKELFTDESIAKRKQEVCETYNWENVCEELAGMLKSSAEL